MVGIYCAGGHARSVVAALRRNEVSVAIVVDDDETKVGSSVGGFTVRDPGSIALDEYVWLVANGTGTVRAQILDRLRANGGSVRNFIDRDTTVDTDISVSRHIYVAARSYISSGVTVADDVLVEGGAYIGHDATLGSHVTVGPNAAVGGAVSIGNRSFVGMGVSVRDEVTIGDDVLVAAGATVVDDVPSNTLVAGTPAEAVREIDEVSFDLLWDR